MSQYANEMQIAYLKKENQRLENDLKREKLQHNKTVSLYLQMSALYEESSKLINDFGGENKLTDEEMGEYTEKVIVKHTEFLRQEKQNELSKMEINNRHLDTYLRILNGEWAKVRKTLEPNEKDN